MQNTKNSTSSSKPMDKTCICNIPEDGFNFYCFNSVPEYKKPSGSVNLVKISSSILHKNN